MRLIGALVGLVSRLTSPFVDLVSWIPARVQFKLLAAFLAIAMLLIMVGAVALEVLSGVHQRVEELLKLQRKIEAYRQVQHDTTTQLYSVASALVSADERGVTVDAADTHGGEHVDYDQIIQARTVFEWGAAPKPDKRAKKKQQKEVAR